MKRCWESSSKVNALSPKRVAIKVAVLFPSLSQDGKNGEVFLRTDRVRVYELGIRHAVRPQTAITLVQRTGQIPFDLNGLSTLQYEVDQLHDPRPKLADRLREAVYGLTTDTRIDSPVYRTVNGLFSAGP